MHACGVLGRIHSNFQCHFPKSREALEGGEVFRYENEYRSRIKTNLACLQIRHQDVKALQPFVEVKDARKRVVIDKEHPKLKILDPTPRRSTRINR